MSKNPSDQSEHNIRLSDIIEEPKRMLPPIQGFENLDLVSLEKSIESLISIVPQIDQMVYTVKQNCIHPQDNLSSDESASIMLYSMEWYPRDKSFYFILNKTLRSENRQLLKPWFLYLRLFIYSLSKLPSYEKTIYRGIKMDLSNDYFIDKKFIWWAFSSCTNTIGILENEEFFGKNDKRTLFSIECYTGKNICNHSMFPNENEILLIAARQFQVTSILNAGNDLHIIQIKEVQPLFPLISYSPPIISLNLSINNSYQNKNLQDIINKYDINSSINLNEQNLTDQDIEIVVQQAIINKKCKELLLKNNKITSNGALIIANALINNTNLEILILYKNYLNDTGVNYLTKILSTNNSTLKTLSLGSNNITNNGIQYLSQMLKTNQSLNVLGLNENGLNDQNLRWLADVLIYNNTTLEILYLSKNEFITDASFNTLIDLFKRNHSLKELWIQNCKLSDNIKQRLRQFIKSKSHFRLEL